MLTFIVFLIMLTTLTSLTIIDIGIGGLQVNSIPIFFISTIFANAHTLGGMAILGM